MVKHEVARHETLADELADLLGKILGVEVDPANSGANLIEAYDANSMDVVDMVEQLERRFTITIPNNDIALFATFGDVLTYVQTRTAK